MAERLPDVVRVAYEFRSQLERNEDEALRRMSRYWVDIEKELEAHYLATIQEIELLKASGTPITPQLVYNLDRYQSMMAQVRQELGTYEGFANDLITDYQERDFLLGLDDANAILKAAEPRFSIWTRVNKDAAEMAAGFAGNGAPLSSLLQTDFGALSAKITDALVSGVALGKGPYATAREMRNAASSLTYDRSVRIARTEINRAYRIANAQQYAASGVVEKVLRLAYKPTACFACLEMDGEECPNGIVDDHPNGKCSSVVKTFHGKMPEWQTGHEWLMEQTEADQRRIMGDGRYEMWKNDGISPRDMVTMRDNPVWGGSPSVISEKKLREMLSDGLLTRSRNSTAVTSSKPERKFEFTPARSIADAEKYIRQFVDEKQFGAVGVSYAGISLDVANEINRTIGRFYNEFDVEPFGGVIAPAGNTKLGKMMTNATAGWVDIRRSLLLNRSSLKTMEVAQKAFAEERMAVDRILQHPERFNLSRLSERVRRVIENSKVSGRGTVPETIEEAINHELGHSLEKLIKKNPLWEQAKANRSSFAQAVSGYACENDSEYIAESFCSYMKGENVIDPIMRTIFEGIRR